MKFSELGLGPAVLKATDKLGYETATPIQAQAIPVVLADDDLIGCAQTGTGKTAAFTLPLIDRLLAGMPPRPPQTSKPKGKPNGKRRYPKRHAGPIRALILAPTRELASQIGESLGRYGQFTGLRHTVVYGGVSQFHQVKALKNGVDTLVATPGRLLDLRNQGHIDLTKVEIFVLDEADQMLDMGFLPDLKRIVDAVPAERQTLMFSATMPPEIRTLAHEWLTEPKSIEVARVSQPAERIEQSVHFVEKKRKADLLLHLIGGKRNARTLVFSRTKHGADKLAKRLSKDGMRAEAIHGNKTQNARNKAIARFKGKNPPVLVATDIAARGLDISGVTHVVNFDLPQTPETYVHRIGRTARAGAEGVAISFCSQDERGLLRQVERLTKSRLEVAAIIDGLTIDPPPPGSPGKKPKRFSPKGAKGFKGGKGRGGKPGKASRSEQGEQASASPQTGDAAKRRRRKPTKGAGKNYAGGPRSTEAQSGDNQASGSQSGGNRSGGNQSGGMRYTGAKSGSRAASGKPGGSKRSGGKPAKASHSGNKPFKRKRRRPTGGSAAKG